MATKKLETQEEIDAYCDNLAKAKTEHAEQRAFFAWLALMQYRGVHQMARMCYAVPNGGKRDQITAARLKAEGVKPGVPDICYPVPVRGWHSLYIEMKKADEGVVSDAQVAMHIDLRACGHCVAVCYGWKMARMAFETYAAGMPVAVLYRALRE